METTVQRPLVLHLGLTHHGIERKGWGLIWALFLVCSLPSASLYLLPGLTHKSNTSCPGCPPTPFLWTILLNEQFWNLRAYYTATVRQEWASFLSGSSLPTKATSGLLLTI